MSVTPLIDPLVEITELKPEREVLSEPSDEFVDLTNNITGSPDDPASAEDSVAEAVKTASELSLEESSDEFVDLTGSEGEAPRGGAALANVPVEAAAADKSEESSDKQERRETSAAPVMDLLGDVSASNTQQQQQGGDVLFDPLSNLLGEAAAPLDAKKPSKAAVDLFEDDGSDLFAEPQQVLSAKQPQKSLFEEPDEDLFGEPLGAALKKPSSKEQKSKPVATKASGDQSSVGGPLKTSKTTEPADIFAEEGVSTPTSSKTNGVQAEEDADLFTGNTHSHTSVKKRFSFCPLTCSLMPRSSSF